MAYSDSCQTAIVIETPDTFPEPDIPKIIPDTGVDHPKTDAEITYLKKKNIDEAIRQKMRNKDVYETDINTIYNLFVGHTNKQLQDKVASGATFRAFKTGREPIRYLIILKKICFLNQYEQHPIRSLCLVTRRLHNTIQYTNDKNTNYLVRFRNAQKVKEACNGRTISRRVQ